MFPLSSTTPMKRLAPFCTACALTLLLVFPAEVKAQEVPYPGSTVFALPGEATNEVILMGDTRSGVYVIGESVALDKFLALAGVSFFERETDQVEVRKTVRVLREQGGERTVIYEARTGELVVQANAYPTLQDGDAIAIETQALRSFDYRQVLRLASELASLTLLGLRLYSVFN